MSSFGAVPLDMVNGNIDFLVSSANKCLQGIPGFSYAIAKKSVLMNCNGNFMNLALHYKFTNPKIRKHHFCEIIS